MLRFLLSCLLSLLPNIVFACACGCGVFEVGTASMLPTDEGGMVWTEYDFMNQDMNWSGSHVAPEANNDDKRLRSQFYTAGMQYMFNRSWGVMAEVPYVNRYFRTDGGSFQHDGLGDVRLKGIYSGFSEDMSTGIMYGLKLPTGEHNHAGFDRDTDIGSGSTNVVLGAYHMGRLTSDNQWSWFANGQWDHAFLIQSDYRPGDEIDAAAGIYFSAGSIGGIGKISPLLQVLVSDRQHDSGGNAAPDDSGYTRFMISPGVEYDINRLKLYGDVEFPVYQNVNGNQLVAPTYFKFIVGYSF